MNELIYDVKYVFQEYLKKHQVDFFNIPEYQRGYKWTAATVTQLLEDLKNFKKSSGDEFYCLQNITVTKSELNRFPCMNVIDGQQRLTTLFIILSFMQWFDDKISFMQRFDDKIIGDDADILRYSIRTTTDKFLREKVQTGVLWNSDIDPSLADSKDQYYIMEVAKAVKEWFDNNKGSISLSTFLHDLRLIVNEVDNGDEETVFASLNGGKVDLDGADLMRAILITRAAKQKYTDNKLRDEITHIAGESISLSIKVNLSEQSKINEYRVKLGIELDQMGRWWSDPDVKAYFEQLLPNRITQNKDFNFRDYPIDLLYYAFFEANKLSLFKEQTEKDLSLRLFENGIDINHRPGDDHLELYNQLRDFHLTMMDWYGDDEIYDLIGYLMYNYKSAVITFALIWNIWIESKTKKEFKNQIKKLIRYELAINFDSDISYSLEEQRKVISELLSGKENEDIEEKLRGLRRSILDISSTDWYGNPFTYKLLPLLDILPFSLKVGGRERKVIKRVKQQYLKRTASEDKEHVRSQTREIDEDNMTEADKENQQKKYSEGLNSLGNIVLLHESVNRSYHNDRLVLKMVRIYSEQILDDTNAYIRPHTFSVFMSKMKDIDNNDIEENKISWSGGDVKRTVSLIVERINDYLHLPAIDNQYKDKE